MTLIDVTSGRNDSAVLHVIDKYLNSSAKDKSGFDYLRVPSPASTKNGAGNYPEVNRPYM